MAVTKVPNNFGDGLSRMQDSKDLLNTVIGDLTERKTAVDALITAARTDGCTNMAAVTNPTQTSEQSDA